ncbi:MAG TPA: glycosyltransferase, partial [Candidatus Saccharimonadales bacterium]|nr:glycosyltransferase [Candidatus Saccharimonadales bacterium]
RQVPYKRIDLIVAACSRLGVPLTVIGRGPEHERLVRMAGPTITFPKDVSDAEMVGYFAEAEAFLFAAYEDFGVTPVEALAAGTPVIAYKAGGALDYVHEGKTGLFFAEQTVAALCEAIQRFDPKKFDPLLIRSTAEAFAPEIFRQRMDAFIRRRMKSRKTKN